MNTFVSVSFYRDFFYRNTTFWNFFVRNNRHESRVLFPFFGISFSRFKAKINPTLRQNKMA